MSNQKNVEFIRSWAIQMAGKCGPQVLDVSGSMPSMRWADAIMREIYGPNFQSHCGYSGLRSNVIEKGLDIPATIVERAKRWQAGEWPSWARSGRLDPGPKDENGEPTYLLVRCHPDRIDTPSPDINIIVRQAIAA